MPATELTSLDQIDPTTPTLLLVHSPNCGHCVRFMPTYQQLKQKNGVSITMINENKLGSQERRNIGLESYPQVYFVYNHECVKFPKEQERTIPALERFIQSQLYGA